MKTETFDIRTGMDVFDASSQKIGRVTEIAGFGSAQVPGVSERGTSELVTQASSGTGYLKVAREGVSGTGAANLTVPFRDIQEVSPGRGVILREAVTWTPNPQPTTREQETSRDEWVSLDEVATITGRSEHSLSGRVAAGKIRSKRRLFAPLSRVYSRRDAERETFQRGEAEVSPR